MSQAQNRSDLERQANKEKTGVWTGAYAVNPVNGKKIPIWVADYVLYGYGTGAIMAVPAHDERDHAFAKAFSLPIVPVVQYPDGHDIQESAYSGDGEAINSGAFNGLHVGEFKKAIIAWLEERGLGEGKVNYKLRDWLFSRQRYWGEPFPIVHNEAGDVIPLSPEELPVILPHIEEYKPTQDGSPPLARAVDWLHTEKDGATVRRETNTMPQWAGSCWYYLRYMDPHNEAEPFSQEAVEYWQNVDMYIGGAEHAVLHLLYARFWHKVLYDCGLVPTKEPFQRLFNQGMLLAHSYRDGLGKYHHPSEAESRDNRFYLKGTDTELFSQVEKMSKSKKNTVDPLEVIADYGADTLRMYEMFMGPLEQVKPWQNAGCKGIRSFLMKVWRLFIDEEGAVRTFGQKDKAVYKALHIAIQESNRGIENIKLNTPIAKMMELVNQCKGKTPDRETAEAFIKILSPYAPHMCEELWQRLGHTESIAYATWPVFDESALVEQSIQLVLMVQGKLRARVDVPIDITKEDALQLAKSHPSIVPRLEGKQIVKEIFVPKKLINLVVR